MDGVDVVDRMDTTAQVNLVCVHIVHKVHAVHHFEKRLRSRQPNLHLQAQHVAYDGDAFSHRGKGDDCQNDDEKDDKHRGEKLSDLRNLHDGINLLFHPPNAARRATGEPDPRSL